MAPKYRVGFITFVVCFALDWFTKYLVDGRHVFKDVIEAYYKQTNQMFGTNYQPPK